MNLLCFVPARSSSTARLAPKPASRLAMLCFMGALSVLGLNRDASAAIITYTDETAFLNALQSGYYRETFASLTPFSEQPSPSTFARNGFSYQVSAPGGLYSGPATVPQISTAVPTDLLTTTVTGGFVNAIGLSPFSGDENGQPEPFPIIVTFSNGATQTFATGSVQNFFGVIDTSAPIGSFTLQSDGFGFASMTNLTVGRAIVAPVPEPSTYAMMFLGVGALGLMTWKRKRGGTQNSTDFAGAAI